MEWDAKGWEDGGLGWHQPELDFDPPQHTTAECEEWAAQVVAEQSETLEGLSS